jgi:pilus assembly protein CpaE
MRTMLVSHSPRDTTVRELDELVRTRFGLGDPETVTLDRAEWQLGRSSPELVIVVLTPEQTEQTLQVIQRLRLAGAGQLLVVGPATDPKAILRAMQFGADLFLDQSDLEFELGSALSRSRGKKAPSSQPGHLLAVLSTAGGCGASTLAVNLATILARECGTCNLIDLNAGKADLGPLLDLKPPYTIADLCRNEDRLDRSMYEKLLVPHVSGVKLLAAPREYADVGCMTARGVARAVTLARESFARVVVDLEDCFHEEQALVLDQATRILLVSRLDFTSIRSTRHILDHLTSRKVPKDRIEIVVNQHGLPNELPVEEAESAIGVKLSHFVPHDPETICEANNTGIPAALKGPDTAVAQSIARLVGLDAPKPASLASLTRVQNWLREGLSSCFRKRFGRPSGPGTPAAAAAAEETKATIESLKDTHESISIPRFHTEPGPSPVRHAAGQPRRLGRPTAV